MRPSHFIERVHTYIPIRPERSHFLPHQPEGNGFRPLAFRPLIDVLLRFWSLYASATSVQIKLYLPLSFSALALFVTVICLERASAGDLRLLTCRRF